MITVLNARWQDATDSTEGYWSIEFTDDSADINVAVLFNDPRKCAVLRQVDGKLVPVDVTPFLHELRLSLPRYYDSQRPMLRARGQ